MKSTTLPPVSVEPEFRAAIEAVLNEGESLADFVSTCVRDGVNWRHTQDAFLARARASIDRAQREGGGLSPAQLLAEMNRQLDAARSHVASRQRQPQAEA